VQEAVPRAPRCGIEVGVTNTDRDQAGELAAPASRPFWPKPIGAFLVMLVAVVLLPALLFSGYMLQRNSQAQSEIVRALAEATAGSIAETVDRELASMQTTLRVVSTANSLGTDLADFYIRASAALLGTDIFLIVADEQMNQLINTRVPFGTQLQPVSDPEPVERALATGAPVVSNGFLGRTSQRWVFNAILPWSSTGDNLALILTRDAEDLAPALAGQNLRGGWNAAIVDGNGMVLASSYMSSDVGKRFFLHDDGPSRSSAVHVVRSFEGRDYQTVSKPSGLSTWRIVLWAPSEVFEAPMRRSLGVLLAGAVGMALVGALGAWLLGRQIAKPVRLLARDARRLGAGETVEAVAYPVAEIAVVSSALAQASHDRQAAENEIRFLMREVAHRSKNQLTVVSSIAKQTGRNARSFAEFQDAFQKRIHGLARSTDLLIAGGAGGVELQALIEAQLEPFRPSDGARCRLEGPAVRLSNQAAQTFGMAVHELATNAAKYGAFSVPSGRLVVEWSVGDGVLEVEWREQVPRRRKRAEGRGFGTEVLERMLGRALQAEIERELSPTGLWLRLRIPLAQIAPDMVSSEA
jgi:two-component sensor histidine kinase